MQGLETLLDTSDFPPRWQCGHWTDVHGWTHVLSDLAVFGAYFAIPVVIVVYMRRRPEVSFPALFWLFAIFILSCGATHLIEATIFWKPWYRLSALAKVVTAIVSWGAVLGLIRVFPDAMRLPGLAAINASLQRENEQRQRVERELRQRNEDLDSFAYMASHDLKAPLRAIGMLSEWVEEDSQDTLSESSREHLQTLRERVTRLERLLDDVLKYSRIGRAKADAEEVDTSWLARQVAEMVGPPEGFEVHVADDMPELTTHRSALQQVFLNLLSNAIKHHDRGGGRIEVSGRLLDGRAEFRVEDDGPGIDPKYHERVFGMFQTLRPRDEVEGSGMGLAIIKKIVENHDGRIWIESTGERGTRFVFTWSLESPGDPHGEGDPTAEDA